MKKILLFFLLVMVLCLPRSVEAQTGPSVYQGEILELLQAGEDTSYKVKLETGAKQGQEIEAGSSLIVSPQEIEAQVGEKVVVEEMKTQEGSMWLVTDYLRQDSLLIILVLFVGVVMIVARQKGLRSLLSMVLSLGLIIKLFLPLLMQGFNPILLSVLLALVLIPITFYLSHGWKKKTHLAVLGTIIALIISGLMANLFVNNAQLSGYASEEAGFLSVEQQGQIDIKALLLASIIIGLLGTLDDVTVTQASFVFQLKKQNKKLNLQELYAEAMKLGQDHIASMVNTLILVYAGAALPLLLLFTNEARPVWYIINQEIVAEEIIRTLVGSIGLILAAPLTTALAVAVANKEELKKKVKVK